MSMREFAVSIGFCILAVACRSPSPAATGSNAAVLGTGATAPPVRSVHLSAGPCESAAPVISLGVKGVPLTDVLAVLSEMSGIHVSSKLDFSQVSVVGDVQNVPWDCVVNDIAKQLDLRVVLNEKDVVLEKR